MPMEYIVPSLHIAVLIGMTNCEALKERLARLEELEEERFLAGFHQQVQKARKMVWHDCQIKQHTFKNGDLVLMYDNKFTKFPGKFQMHCLGPYIVKDIINGGVIQLVKLNGKLFPGRINGSWLKLYRGNPAPMR